MTQWLDMMLYGNSVADYLFSAGILSLFLLMLTAARRTILRRFRRWAEQTVSTLDDFIVSQMERSLFPVLYGAGVYIALQYLSLTDQLARTLQSALVVLATVYTAKFIIAALNFMLSNYWGRRQGDEQQSLKGISGFIAIAVWSLSVVFLLDNLGFKVSTIVAGLGIGGIAVALAAQTILGDLFSYFVIFFDRPFRVGDFIIVDDKLGAVEYIGIKTTRIRSLSGEELVFSNKDLTDSRIHNFKKMDQRRVVFTIGIAYQTPLDTIKEIPGILKAIITAQENVLFDRAHFKEYGNFSLNFEAVYFVSGSDYNRYMDTQQHINLAIFEEFESRKIMFAYPTQTIFVHRQT